MLRRFLRDIFMNEIKVKSFSTPWQCYSSTRDVQSCSKSHIATKDGYLPFRRRVSIFPSTKTMTKTMTNTMTKLMTMTKTKAQFLSDSGSPLLSWYSSSKHRHFCQPSSVVFSDLYHLHFFFIIANYSCHHVDSPWSSTISHDLDLETPPKHSDHPDTMVTTPTYPCWPPWWPPWPFHADTLLHRLPPLWPTVSLPPSARCIQHNHGEHFL